MAKKPKKVDTAATRRQMPLLALLDELRQSEQQPSNEGSLNVREQLRVAINEALKGCSLSRWEVGGRMSHLLGVEISKYMIDAWTAESKDGHRFPAEYLPAFCEVTGDRRPLSILASKAGLFALPGPDALRAEIQKLDEQAKHLQREKQKRLLFLKEMEVNHE